MTFRIDPRRARSLAEQEYGTGIYVRALNDQERWVNADIVHLDTESLDAWLRSRDSIEWPIAAVKIILGHRQ